MSSENLKIKSAIVDEIKGKLDKAQSVVVIDYMGTSVEQDTEMRRKLRSEGVDYSVYKNTLIARAVVGTPFEELRSVLNGPSALAFSEEDAVAPARVLSGCMKAFDKMSFKAGIVEGIFYDADGLKTLASIPSRDELIAKFMGSIQSPVGKLVRTFRAVADAREE